MVKNHAKAGVVAFLILVASFSRAENCREAVFNPSHRWGVGLNIKALMPSLMPDWQSGLPVYGAMIAMPVWNDHVFLHASYGTANNFVLSLFELSYRFSFDNPFFYPYFELGPQYLNYKNTGLSHKVFGVHAGFGVQVPFGKDMVINLFAKTYVHVRTIFSVGLGFWFVL